MLVIDTRTGKRVEVGQVIDYGDGETLQLMEVKPGLSSAEARILVTYADPRGTLVTTEQWTPLVVRWMHPKYFGQHVAFLPS